ncbi:hypothetical protein WI92_23580 [Burkholderia vietnamiensis]|nr:hypothetical protein WI92_23580 [Burkholderia vietnamiensis]
MVPTPMTTLRLPNSQQILGLSLLRDVRFRMMWDRKQNRQRLAVAKGPCGGSHRPLQHLATLRVFNRQACVTQGARNLRHVQISCM